jgi:LPS-assembly lipoprotein
MAIGRLCWSAIHPQYGAAVAAAESLVQTVRMIRSFIAVLILVSGLSACGFHLRNKLMLPPDVPALQVSSVAPYSELAKLLRRGVRASGATLVEDDAHAASAQLNVLSERWGDLPIAIDSQGRAQEYSLRYAVIFTMLGPDGSVVVPQQVIELSRDYISNAEDNTGTANEREILADEMRRDMSASILRRIDSVVRARLSKGEGLHDRQQPATKAPAAEASP